jgi:hypothetical protein
MSDDLAEIQEAIKRLHGCESRHVGALPVKEVYQPCGRPMPAALAFDGVVDVFMLADHKTARLCFAWISPEASGGNPVVVLEGQYHKHTDDPHAAVRGWMRYELESK